MEEIKIYHSPWRMSLLIIICLAAAVGLIFMLHHPRHTLGISEMIVIGLCIAFFGPGGLYLLYVTLKESITDIPYLTITDTSCTINQGLKHAVINFADVKSFKVTKMGDQEFVTVHYRPDVEIQKMKDANIPGRILRKMNKGLVNAQEIIATTGTSLETQELYKLLYDRLRRFQFSHNFCHKFIVE